MLMPQRDWAALLAEYPTSPDDFQAVPEPAWADLSGTVTNLESMGAVRAVARYLANEPNTLYSDARLEGFAFSEPEIVAIINGEHVSGHADGHVGQVAGLMRAGSYLLNRIADGQIIEPGQRLSDDLHLFITSSIGLKSHAFRGDQRAQYTGPRVRLGGSTFTALDSRLTHAALDAGLERIEKIEHPVLRSATWAAFATYHQFYLDGNKRTGRYMMNAVLLSHGYDAIHVSERLKAEYENALIEAYKTGDLTPHIAFLLALYDDR